MSKLFWNAKNSIIFLSIFFCIPFSFSQTNGNSVSSFDKNIIQLNEISVVGYVQPQIQWETPTSVSILNKKEIDKQSTTTMVPVMNTVPGVRMEERSPGSYRLSIRGSLTRSPYGVRNIKIYYNGFSLTDAGGNTYLNALNINDISGIEILKGPDGSLFGANSGGVVLFQSNINHSNDLKFNIYGGSYGLIGNAIHFSKNLNNHFLSVKQSFQRADGYRQNTQNNRLFIQISDVWKYNSNGSLEIYSFYSAPQYRTPGGLTFEQFTDNPKQSRPPTATQPGSADQKSGVNSKIYFAGIKNQYQISSVLEHNISVWGTYVDFINSFITNYETRDERNLGFRTTLSLNNLKLSQWKPSLDVGFEGQRMISDIYNYDNNKGIKGAIQAYNNIINYQYFGFLRGRIKWKNSLIVEGAVSLNFNGYNFSDTTQIKNNFVPVWIPHIGINYIISNPVAVRFTVSKGYSTPTTAEVRPADNKIYKNLQPEQGWNTEAGIRIKLLNERILLDASCFHYLLQDGIISQMDSTGNTYFVNSGEIRQIGFEYTGSYILLPFNNNRILKRIQWNNSYTYSYFHYNKYVINNTDYSGNRVAGVPRHVFINNLEFTLPWKLSLFIQHNYTDKIPLNDGNTEFADSYNLISLKINMDRIKESNWIPKIYFAVDNLLNEKYSLGNDINAFGGRYYNAAPTINFHVGMIWEFL